MTKKLLLFSFLLTCASVFSQNRITKEQLSENWMLINSSNGINFYAKYESVDVYKNGTPNFTFAVVKIENTTNQAIDFNFLISGFYDGGCIGCSDNIENTKSLSLKAGETFVGTAENNFCRLVNNPNNKLGWKFEAIGINNITIK